MGALGGDPAPGMQQCPVETPPPTRGQSCANASVTGGSVPPGLASSSLEAFVLEHSSFLSFMEQVLPEDLAGTVLSPQGLSITPQGPT